MLHFHQWLDRHRPMGLHDALCHALGHVGSRIADIDLADGDVVRAPIEGSGFGQSRHCMFGGGIGD